MKNTWAEFHQATTKRPYESHSAITLLTSRCFPQKHRKNDTSLFCFQNPDLKVVKSSVFLSSMSALSPFSWVDVSVTVISIVVGGAVVLKWQLLMWRGLIYRTVFGYGTLLNEVQITSRILHLKRIIRRVGIWSVCSNYVDESVRWKHEAHTEGKKNKVQKNLDAILWLEFKIICRINHSV